jgi:quinol-cytochrome oxidoreductase complex cytochrome b subunit
MKCSTSLWVYVWLIIVKESNKSRNSSIDRALSSQELTPWQMVNRFFLVFFFLLHIRNHVMIIRFSLVYLFYLSNFLIFISLNPLPHLFFFHFFYKCMNILTNFKRDKNQYIFSSYALSYIYFVRQWVIFWKEKSNWIRNVTISTRFRTN